MIKLERFQPKTTFYTGMSIEISAPDGNRFVLWPEEKWNWLEPDGELHDGFVHSKDIEYFRQDPETGAISYQLNLGPAGCDSVVRITPAEDTVLIEHEIDNRGEGTVLGGSPCFQIGRAKDFQSWTFEQAKRTFAWTQEDGFAWISDTRRTGETVNPGRKCFCQAYRLDDPAPGTIFGRSPDKAAAPLIGAVSRDGRSVVGCAGEEPSDVCHALLNCLHVFVQNPVKPGEKKKFRYTLYFLDSIEELVRRAAADYPQYQFHPAGPAKLRLAGEGTILMSFEDLNDLRPIEGDGVNVRYSRSAPMSVENERAITHGVTHGQDAALCEFEDGGTFKVAQLFSRRQDDRYLSLDLTVPEERNLAMRVALKQEGAAVEKEFELHPGAPRRCVVPLEGLKIGESADLLLAPAGGKSCRIQLDCIALH
jgi:hypothetical protein